MSTSSPSWCAAIRAGLDEPLRATAPERAASWLLIEHPGPWPSTGLPADLPREVALFIETATTAGVRPQLIRRVRRAAAAPRRSSLRRAGRATRGSSVGASPTFPADIGEESIRQAEADDVFVSSFSGGQPSKERFLRNPLWKGLTTVKAGRVTDVADEVWMTSVSVQGARLVLDDLATTFQVDAAAS